MPVKINCPTCNASLTMPESMYGKAVRCPSCRNPFQCPAGPAPAAKPAAPAPVARPTPAGRAAPAGGNPFDFEAPQAVAAPADYSDEQYVRPRRPSTGWPAVRGGLFWFHLSAAAFTLVFLVLLILILGQVRMAPTGLLVVMILLALITYSALVFWMLGLMRCRKMPRECEGRGAAGGGSIFALIGVIFGAVFLVMFILERTGALGRPGEAVQMIELFSMLFMSIGIVGSAVLFFFMLALSGVHLSSSGLRRGAVAYFTILVVSPMAFTAVSLYFEFVFSTT